MKWRSKIARTICDLTPDNDVKSGVTVLVERLRAASRAAGQTRFVAGPPYSPEEYARTLGVAEICTERASFEGSILEGEAGLRLVLDEEVHSRERQRFVLAHEVGHLLLWRYLGASMGMRTHSSKRSEVERLCDMIGSELLAPSREVAVMLESLPSTGEGFLQGMVDTARVFGVSLQFSAIRIGEVSGRRFGSALYETNSSSFRWVRGLKDKSVLRNYLGVAAKREGDKGDALLVVQLAGREEEVQVSWRRTRAGQILAVER